MIRPSFPNFNRAWADRVVFLRDGRVVDQTVYVGPTEAVRSGTPR